MCPISTAGATPRVPARPLPSARGRCGNRRGGPPTPPVDPAMFEGGAAEAAHARRPAPAGLEYVPVRQAPAVRRASSRARQAMPPERGRAGAAADRVGFHGKARAPSAPCPSADGRATAIRSLPSSTASPTCPSAMPSRRGAPGRAARARRWRDRRARSVGGWGPDPPHRATSPVRELHATAMTRCSCWTRSPTGMGLVSTWWGADREDSWHPTS